MQLEIHPDYPVKIRVSRCIVMVVWNSIQHDRKTNTGMPRPSSPKPRPSSSSSSSRRRSRSPISHGDGEDRRRDSDGGRRGRRREEQEGGRSWGTSARPSSLSNVTTPAEKEKPSLKPSGALVADTNSYKGVVLKYSEPPEARLPSSSSSCSRYRLYVFKDKEQVDLLHINHQSAYLLGRERLVADIPIDHPSCSKQHAVLQYRQTVSRDPMSGSVLPSAIKLYIIDLGSANGTRVNRKQIPASRFYELRPGDIIQFGQSSREYVLMDESEVD